MYVTNSHATSDRVRFSILLFFIHVVSFSAFREFHSVRLRRDSRRLRAPPLVLTRHSFAHRRPSTSFAPFAMSRIRARAFTRNAVFAFALAFAFVAAFASVVVAAPASARAFFDLSPFDVRDLARASHNALVRIDRMKISSSFDDGSRPSEDAPGFRVRAPSRARAGDVVVVDVETSEEHSTGFHTHWIAAYSPGRANVSAIAPVKYAVLVNVTKAYATTGRASAAFRLTGHRAESYDFVVFASPLVIDDDGIERPAIDRAVAMARSEEVAIEGALAPMWPRVTLSCAWGGATKSGASARVTWQSGRNASHGARLMYRVIGDEEFTRANAGTTTYDVGDLCGEPATGFGFRHPGYTHSADISAVKAGDRVEYYVADAHETSDRFEMRMPVEEGPDSSVTIAMFADMGRGSDDDTETWDSYGAPALNVSAALAADAKSGKIHAAFLFGDLSYAVGFASVWDDWAEQIQSFASAVPFLTNMGNHELDSPPETWPATRIADSYGGDDSGGECGVPATTLFPTPRAGPDADWFAVTLGSIRLISIATEVNFEPTSAQYKWLARELATIDRAHTPWVIIGGHRPAIVDSTDGPEHRRPPPPGKLNPSDLSVMAALQEHVWPLLVRHNVTAAFWGHNHVYQRSCAWRAIGDGIRNASDGCVAYSVVDAHGVAVYNNPEAPVNIVVGTAGAKHTHNGQGHSFTEKSFYEFGYVRLTALNRTHMYGEFQEAGAGYGDVLDKFLIIQRDNASADGDRANEDAAKLIAQLRAQVAEWKSVTYVMAFLTAAALCVFSVFVFARWRETRSFERHRFQILDEGGEL